MIEPFTRAMISSMTVSAASEADNRKAARKLSRNRRFIIDPVPRFYLLPAAREAQSEAFGRLSAPRCTFMVPRQLLSIMMVSPIDLTRIGILNERAKEVPGQRGAGT